MGGAVVAVEAGVVDGFRGKCTSDLQVAGGTFFFENGMRFGELATTVNAGVFEKSASGDPEERKQRKQEAEPEFRALQQRRPLEIVQVDALREFFCCSSSRHSFTLSGAEGSLTTRHFFNIAAQSPRESRRAKSVRAKAECAAAASRAASGASAPAA